MIWQQLNPLCEKFCACLKCRKKNPPKCIDFCIPINFSFKAQRCCLLCGKHLSSSTNGVSFPWPFEEPNYLLLFLAMIFWFFLSWPTFSSLHTWSFLCSHVCPHHNPFYKRAFPHNSTTKHGGSFLRK